MHTLQRARSAPSCIFTNANGPRAQSSMANGADDSGTLFDTPFDPPREDFEASFCGDHFSKALLFERRVQSRNTRSGTQRSAAMARRRGNSHFPAWAAEVSLPGDASSFCLNILLEYNLLL